MTNRLRRACSTSVAIAWFALTICPAFAHNGEDHGGSGMPESWWVGAVGVVVVAALVSSLVWRGRADEPGMEGDGNRAPLEQ